MTREITHLKAFTLALESPGKNYLEIGQIQPSEEVVNLFFNDSIGEGEEGTIDCRGPWNDEGKCEFVESPAFAGTARQDSVHAEAKVAKPSHSNRKRR